MLADKGVTVSTPGKRGNGFPTRLAVLTMGHFPQFLERELLNGKLVHWQEIYFFPCPFVFSATHGAFQRLVCVQCALQASPAEGVQAGKGPRVLEQLQADATRKIASCRHDQPATWIGIAPARAPNDYQVWASQQWQSRTVNNNYTFVLTGMLASFRNRQLIVHV